MDRDSLRNFLFPNGMIPESYGGNGSNGGGTSQNTSDQFVPSPPYGPGMPNGIPQQLNQNNESSGYPLLIQEYLRQQQQQQQLQINQAAAAPFQQPLSSSQYSSNNNLSSFSMMLSNSNLSNRSLSSFDNNTTSSFNFQDQGRNATWFVPTAASGGPPSVAGTLTSSSASDLSTSDRVMLERLQATSNAPFAVGNPGSGMSAAAAATANGCLPGFGMGVNGAPPNTTAAGTVSSVSLRDLYAEQGILGPWSERSAGLLGSMVCSQASSQPAKIKRTRRKQPKDKPKRPLSAYNIFFKEERARLLNKATTTASDDSDNDNEQQQLNQRKTANGKIGFESLAKIIGGKWQELTPSQVEYYKGKAGADMERYKKEMELYNSKQGGRKQAEEVEDEARDSDEASSPKRQKTN